MSYRRHKSTMILVLVAVVLTGVVIWDRGSVSTSEADRRAENCIDAWRQDDLSRVDLVIGERRATLARERDADGQLAWVLSEGDERLDGDEQAMSDYLSTLEMCMFAREIDDVDRASLGLTSPRGTITVAMGQLSYVLRIGGPAPSPAGASYLEVEGGGRGRRTYVITGPVTDELLVDVNELLAKRLAMLYSPSVQRYVVESQAGKVVLERGGWGGSTAGAFLVRDGSGAVRANRLEMDKLFLAINDIEVDGFVAVPTVELEQAVSLTIVPAEAGKPEVKLTVGRAPPERCGSGRALAVRHAPDAVAGCVDESLLERLAVRPEQMGDRFVVGTAEGDIIELKLTEGDTVVDVARKGEGWHMRKPDEGAADEEAMAELLRRMMDARGLPINSPDLAGLGLEKPRAELRILGLPERVGSEGDKDREERIAVGAVVDGTVHVRRLDDGVVLALDADTGALFLPRPTLLRSTQIFAEQTKHVRGLRLSCGGRKQELLRDLATQWSFAVPNDAEVGVDGALVTEVVDAVLTLKAVRWVAEEPAERHALGAPWCTVTVELLEPDEADPSGEKQNQRELTVMLGAEAQGGYFAKTGTGDAVFVAPRAFANAADAWLFSRSALLPNIKDAEVVTLRGKDRALSMRRQGESWKVEGGADALGVTVANALDQLAAEIVIHRGEPTEGSGFEQPVLTIEIQSQAERKPVIFRIGKAETWRNALVYNVRRSDMALTFLAARSRVQPLVDAL